MVVSKGRNDIRAAIEDFSMTIEALTIDINSYYKSRVKEKKDDIQKIVIENSHEDYEILKSMTYHLTQEIEYLEDFHKEFLGMLLVKIYTYAETYFETLLSRLSYDRIMALTEYKKDGQPANNVSEIEKYFYVLQKHKKLSVSNISDIWKDFKSVHSIRKSIIHHNTVNKCICFDYIISNINQAYQLLITIELETR